MFVESYGQVAVQGSSFSPKVDARARPGHPEAAAGRILGPQRVPDVIDVRRPQLARPLDPAVGRLGQQPAALRPARRERPLHAQPGVQARRLAHRRRRARRTTGPGPRARRSTTTTSSTTGATSATTAPTTRYASMPDQYVFAALQRLELAKTHRQPLFAEVDLVSSHAPWTQHPPADRLERGRRRLDLQAPPVDP